MTLNPPEKIIFHIDMDAFFTSIEQRDAPELKGKPVIVGALPGNRGVVSAASYEARKYGVRSAMPVSQAFANCRNGIFLRPRMDVYCNESKKIFEILESFSPSVESISIDEAFVDMTGTEILWGKPLDAARQISEKIIKERNLTASIGIAPNKYLAKLASDMNKPFGITMVPFNKDEIISWLAPLPVSCIWGVGKVTQKNLLSFGIVTIGDLQKISQQYLEKKFGKSGKSLFQLSRGIDSREVEQSNTVQSISREYTFPQDCSDVNQWHSILLSLCRDIAYKARQRKLKGTTIFLTYRTPDFKRYNRQKTVSQPVDLAKEIYSVVKELLVKEMADIKYIRLIGVGITNFAQALQTDLFEDVKTKKVLEKSETTMDKLTDKFGSDIIFRASEMTSHKVRNHSRGYKTRCSAQDGCE